MHIPGPNSFEQKPFARLWLITGVFALALSGLFALLIAVARTPGLSKLPMVSWFFGEALVVHVNLSILVWFLSLAGMSWSLLIASAPRSFLPLETMDRAALMSFALGALLMCLAPLDVTGESLKSNYIPVITSPVFFVSLGLLASSMLLAPLAALLSGPSAAIPTDMRLSLRGAAVITLLALLAFALSLKRMPGDITGEAFYDLVFWGGGHIMQFTHIQMLLVAWSALIAAAYGAQLPPRIARWVYAFGPLSAIIGLYPYAAYGVYTAEFRQFFTHHMMVFCGIAPLLLGVWFCRSLKRKTAVFQPGNRVYAACLWCSLLLFTAGGALGFHIQSQDATIPAHYHGSIVGVTLALMGLAYVMLPRFGYRDVKGWKLAFWQPIIYTVGQCMHVGGLAFAGGYGALRKTPGVDTLPLNAKIGMGVMGMGGLIAITGGICFVLVMWRAMRR